MATVSAPDVATVLVSYLSSVTGVTDEVGSNVYRIVIPHTVTSPTKTVVVAQTGGVDDPDLARIARVSSVNNKTVSTGSVQIKCFGADYNEARSVYQAVNGALQSIQNAAVGSNAILWCEQTTGPQSLVDPDLGWPFVLVNYEVWCY